MRKSLIETLFPGTRRRVLGAVLQEPEREWYLSDFAAHLGLTVSSMQKEVRLLADAGVLKERRDGNRVYYSANPECPVFGELRSIFEKER